jgi:hypothetical protein
MNRLLKTWVILGLIISTVTLSCKRDPFPDNDGGVTGHFADLLSNEEVIKWSHIAFEADGGAAEPHPLLASRSNTMMHIAIHDALNAIVPVYEQYAYKQKCAVADPFAAVASASYTVLKALWPDQDSMLTVAFTESLADIADGIGKTQGIALGIASAKAILELRANDDAYQNPVEEVPVSHVPGVYNAVPPPNFMFARFWKTMQLFALQSHDQFRSAPPPDLKSDKYATDYNEIKEVGALNSKTRTADQSAYAKFWYEFADIGWNRIARNQAMENNAGLYTTARMFALLNMAISDSYTAGWDAKYYYFFWRPYTAIRAGNTDGNAKTTEDINWEPAEVTPAVPEYPGTHSAIGNASAVILTRFFGNNTHFSTTSTTAATAGSVRSFDSFIEAANENADSRIMAGIHFRFSCDAGQKQGADIGNWTLEHHLKRLQ